MSGKAYTKKTFISTTPNLITKTLCKYSHAYKINAYKLDFFLIESSY